MKKAAVISVSPTGQRPTVDPQGLSQQRELTRSRVALITLFALMGLSFAAWLARVPTVQVLLDLTTADLGLVFLAGAIGSLVCVTIAGPLVVRFGGRRLLTIAALAIGVAYFFIGLGPAVGSVGILAGGLALNGGAVALTNVPQNVESAGLERRVGKPIVAHFHAAFSIGAVLGSLIGAACAHFEVPVLIQFSVTGLLTVVVRLLLIPLVVVETAQDQVRLYDRVRTARQRRVHRAEVKAKLVQRSAPRPIAARVRASRLSLGNALGAWREPRTLMIGVIIFSASMSEGSANNWLSVAVVEGFDKLESTGATVLAVFLASMTLVRLTGAPIITRLGRVQTLRLSTLISMVGLLVFALVPSFPLAIAGVVAWGMGAALVVPLTISAASDEPMHAAARVSVVSAHASIASLVVPPILGFLAAAIGTREALASVCISLVLALVVSRAIAPIKVSR